VAKESCIWLQLRLDCGCSWYWAAAEAVMAADERGYRKYKDDSGSPCPQASQDRAQ